MSHIPPRRLVDTQFPEKSVKDVVTDQLALKHLDEKRAYRFWHNPPW